MYMYIHVCTNMYTHIYVCIWYVTWPHIGVYSIQVCERLTQEDYMCLDSLNLHKGYIANLAIGHTKRVLQGAPVGSEALV